MTQSIEQQAEERCKLNNNQMITQEQIENKALSYSNDYYNKFNCHSTANGFIAGYQQALDSAPRWVKLEDQETPFDGDYLCIIQRQNECGTVSISQRVINNCQNAWVLGGLRDKVTHWMPLPSPPKTETDGK